MLKAFNGFNGATTFSYLQPFKSSIFYSTLATLKDGVTNTPPMLEFLTKSVGFSEEEAASIITKVSSLSKCTTKHPDMVVNFLKRNGFEETHIKRLITSVPEVLRFKIDKNLEPKFRALQELGLRGPDLALLLSVHSCLLRYNLEARIIPSLATIRSVVGNNEQLISFLLKTKTPKLFSYNFMKFIPQNLLLLQNYGLSSAQIKQLMLLKPLALLQKSQCFENNLISVEEKLEIPRTSAMFVHGIAAMSIMSEDKLESRLQVFRSYKWSEADIKKMLRTHPLVLTLSEKLVMVKLKYFMDEQGYGSDYLSMHPTLLSFSLEKRIVPRTTVIQALKDNKLLKNDISLYTFICISESNFVKKYVVNFKNVLPQLYEDYMKQKL